MAFVPTVAVTAPPARTRTTRRARKLFTTAFPRRSPATFPRTPLPCVPPQPPIDPIPVAPPSKPTTTPLAPPAPTKAPIKPAKRQRKPHGYWNDIANLERELLLVREQLSLAPRTIPRLADLSTLQRADIIAALSKHGGLKKVAVALRWSLSTSRKKKYPVPRPRRRNNYWDDVANLHREIRDFIGEYGTIGVMPTRNQFYTYGRSDLINAASQHGGLLEVARSLGLKAIRGPRKRNHHFQEFETLKRAIIKFSKKHTDGRMPTGDELIARGESGLANAISSNGGFPSVAKQCGLAVRGKGQGAPEVWDEKRLKRELLGFCMAYYPELAKENGMPTERMLRKYGRCDLSYAVCKFGGFAKVAKRLGMKRGMKRLSSAEL